MKISELKNKVILEIPESEKFFNQNLSDDDIIRSIINLPNSSNLQKLIDIGIFELKKDRINKHDCINCTLKHISTSSTIIIEMLNGYNNDDYEMYLMGNLNEAQEQIAGINLDISNKIRNLRIDIFETQNELNIEHLNICRTLYTEIKSLKENPKLVIKKSDTKIEDIKKPCSCSGNKNTSNNLPPK